MTEEEISQARLFEELSLERIQRPGESPQWGGYGGYHAGRTTWTHTVAGVDFIYVNDKGEMHRIYGPAYVSKKYKMTKWFKEGILHREGGPALQHETTFHWYYEGELHNLEGPAVVDPAGPCQYWIHGVRMSRKEYTKEIARRKKRGLIK